MKKFFPLSNIGWIMIIMLIASGCNNSSNSTNTAGTNCTYNFPGVEADKLLKGIARYRKFQWNASNARISAELAPNQVFEDARACWYSLEQLKEFICQIENQQPGTPGERGIRFYYAAYPDTQTYTMLSQESGFTKHVTLNVGLRHTLFMVPTIQYKELNVDFITPLPTGSENRPVKDTMQRFLTASDWERHMKMKTPLLVLGGAYKTSTSSQNQGMMCPPDLGCPTDPASPIRSADSMFPDGVITKN